MPAVVTVPDDYTPDYDEWWLLFPPTSAEMLRAEMEDNAIPNDLPCPTCDNLINAQGWCYSCHWRLLHNAPLQRIPNFDLRY